MKRTMEHKNSFFIDGRTILFVDDERGVLASIERVFHDEPHNFIFAQSGTEALGILQREEVHIIVTDMGMPQMNGLELLRTVKEDYPHIIRLVLSGNTGTVTLLDAINQGEIFRFIPKPWKSNEEFKIVIRQAIEFYDLHGELEMLMQVFEQWIEGKEVTNMSFLRELVASRKKHLYEWKKKSNPIQPNLR